jgi:hypothetical protein
MTIPNQECIGYQQCGRIYTKPQHCQERRHVLNKHITPVNGRYNVLAGHIST